MQPKHISTLSDIIDESYLFDGYITQIYPSIPIDISNLKISETYEIRARPMVLPESRKKFKAKYLGELKFEIVGSNQVVTVFPTYVLNHFAKFNNILVFSNTSLKFKKLANTKEIIRNVRNVRKEIKGNLRIGTSEGSYLKVSGYADISESKPLDIDLDQHLTQLNNRGIRPEFTLRSVKFFKKFFEPNEIQKLSFYILPVNIYQITDDLYFMDGIIKNSSSFCCFFSLNGNI